jgi:hypothetical protein
LAGAGSDFAARAFACFAYGGAIAAPWLGLLWALERGARLTQRRAMLAFAAAGLLANAALLFHCPITHVAHRVWGHASIGIVLAVLGALLIVSAAKRQRGEPKSSG